VPHGSPAGRWESSTSTATLVIMSIDVRRPLAVDLFAGAGGLSLGLEQAGYEIAAAVEYDPIHAAVHEFNFPYGTTFCDDVSKITGADIRERSQIKDREIHLVAGGPPCQGISMIGRRAIDDPRNALLKEFVRVVLELRPRYFLMENVAGLMVGGHRQLVDEVVQMVESTGEYRVLTPIRVLQAADYGSPQSRKRVFVLGARSDVALPVYPEATNTPRAINGIVPTAGVLPLGPSVSDALGDLPDADLFENLLYDDKVDDVVYGRASEYAARLRGTKKDPTDYSRPRPRPAKGLSSSARTVHTRKSIDRFSAALPGTTEKVSRFLRLHPEGLSNTLRAGTASDRGAYTAPRPIHPTLPRVITVREAARLHGYPDWFRFHVTKWNGFRQIGNSVPARLGRAVGAAILQADGAEPTPGKPTKLGSPSLLYMTAGQAHAHFGLAERVIPQRDRKVG
jgi:DNA (cytosine-5)-methyltransferase 1